MTSRFDMVMRKLSTRCGQCETGRHRARKALILFGVANTQQGRDEFIGKLNGA
jgi:hypothetical protein